MCNNSLSGACVLASFFAAGSRHGDHEHAAYVGVCGVLGLSGATLAALLLSFGGHAVRSGLFGYNGVLVGLALATFLVGIWDVGTMLEAVVLGAVSAVLQLAWGNITIPTFESPPFTLAFNTTLVWFLLACQAFGAFSRP